MEVLKSFKEGAGNMRLVDADALKEDCSMANDCKDCKTYVRDCEYDRIYTKMDFCGWLDDAPTVDAVPVRHGKWMLGVSLWYCSECGSSYSYGDYAFCPNCGARMDGKDGEGRE